MHDTFSIWLRFETAFKLKTHLFRTGSTRSLIAFGPFFMLILCDFIILYYIFIFINLLTN